VEARVFGGSSDHHADSLANAIQVVERFEQEIGFVFGPHAGA